MFVRDVHVTLPSEQARTALAGHFIRQYRALRGEEVFDVDAAAVAIAKQTQGYSVREVRRVCWRAEAGMAVHATVAVDAAVDAAPTHGTVPPGLPEPYRAALRLCRRAPLTVASTSFAG